MVSFGPAYEPLVVTENDLIVATMFYAWTLGFGYFVGLHCVREFRRSKRWISPYLALIWAEFFACIIYGTICWLYLHGIIPPGFGIFFATTTIWAVQIQCVLQIICNRVGVLLPDDRSRLTLKLSVAFFVLLINISVYCIWIPSKMGVDEKFKQINVVWDRVEKVIYLFIDMALNAYFIISVKRRLVAYGLRKYDALVRYNTWIATVSVSMDVFIICMMSLKNDFVYNQVHPVAYMVKLNIEISMSDLIRRVATSTGTAQLDSQSIHVDFENVSSSVTGTSGQRGTRSMGVSDVHFSTNPVEVQIDTEVATDMIHLDNFKKRDLSSSRDHDHESENGEDGVKHSDTRR
ncbi:hypothetical protein K523DRAFT_358096 [Schizophyllum commune Tattone D]|nr:hypothetical protein K523DRAFT_358096 [Schizophyllum commune Tattone D]